MYFEKSESLSKALSRPAGLATRRPNEDDPFSTNCMPTDVFRTGGAAACRAMRRRFHRRDYRLRRRTHSTYPISNSLGGI